MHATDSVPRQEAVSDEILSTVVSRLTDAKHGGRRVTEKLEREPHSQPSAGRFIPARAENMYNPRALSHLPSVHPRAGGEHVRRTRNMCGSVGSSPRGRGTFPSAASRSTRSRFIPARAGNITIVTRPESSGPVHPRAGGEHAATSNTGRIAAGSSPRGRGTCATWRSTRRCA